MQPRVLERLVKIAATLALTALIAGACGDNEAQSSFSSNIRDAENPLGEKPLADMPDDQIRKALAATRAEIQSMRPTGMALFLTALKEELDKRGLDSSVIDKIDDNTVGAAEATAKPMPGGTVANEPIGTKSSSLRSQRFALGAEDHAQYYSCPLDANNEGSPTDKCGEIVDTVVAKVQNDIEQDQDNTQQEIGQQYSDLDATSLQFVTAWAQTAKAYGANVAAIYAKYELKAAAQCDDQTNAHNVATSLGKEQGWQIVESFRTWAISQVNSCVVNTDAIAEQVRVMSRNEVDEFMTENKICESADFSTNNAALKEADAKRKTGINEGIDERIEILRNELFQARQTAPCNEGGDGGDGGDGGGGDPLVIDLDDDGVTLSTDKVKFDLLGDGTQQSTNWIGKREGIVAIDLDGDGLITSSKELMSDKCGEGYFCYDGARGLAVYDSAERGGNADGVIDRKDQVFAQLRIWVDANGDAVSQACEVAPLADHGILSISLAVDDMVQKHEAGTVTARMQVMTKSGVKDAYDVWLKLELKPENLAALLPTKR